MSFDTLAPGYHAMERLLAGKKLHQCRTAFLDDFQDARSILLLGEGHGRFVRELLKTDRNRSILCVDGSRGMIEVARKRIGADPRVSFVHCDVFAFDPGTEFDAIATHFFLDCFTREQLEKLIPKIASWIGQKGIWHVADFQIPAPLFRRIRAKMVLALAYGFFRVATRLPARAIAPPQKLLSASGMLQSARQEFNFGLLYSELWRKQ